ncbi:MAG TPA: hypothetical protein VHV74_13630 [Pseudonocardiaceae bacterium]|nr:hypothetical protein [Pseudonocardiaceae bacterium]
MTSEALPEALPRPEARLNQPWRFGVAAGELVLAAVAVVFGIVLWRHGIKTLITPLGDGKPALVSTIFYGDWMAMGIGLVTVAAVLVLDAIREVILALRTRTRRTPPEVTVELPAE